MGRAIVSRAPPGGIAFLSLLALPFMAGCCRDEPGGQEDPASPLDNTQTSDAEVPANQGSHDLARPDLPLPELPAHLGRIHGRVRLASDKIRAVATGRASPWLTAVFLENVPENQWKAALGGPPPAKNVETVVWRNCAGAEHKLNRMSRYMFDPPIVLCLPGDKFGILIKGIPGDHDFGRIYRPEDGPSGKPPERYALDLARTRAIAEHGLPYPRGEDFVNMCLMTPQVEPFEDFLGPAWHFARRSWEINPLWPGAQDRPNVFLNSSGGSPGDGGNPDVQSCYWGWAMVEGSGGIDMVCVGGATERLFVVGVQNPYHALVDLVGSPEFVLDRVPPGLYWLRTFDPFFENVRRPVRVRAGEVAEGDLGIEQRQVYEFWSVAMGREPGEGEVCDELEAAEDSSISTPVRAPISRGRIEGKILIRDPELSSLARERPPVYRTAVFVENVEEDTWELAPSFPAQKPLELSLTNVYAGNPHIEEGTKWVYAPSTVNVLALRDCLRLVEPGTYAGVWRVSLLMRGIEAFEPAGGRIFPGRMEAYEEMLNVPERFHYYANDSVDPFLTHPLRRSIEQKKTSDFAYPLLRVQGWGRVECLYRAREEQLASSRNAARRARCPAAGDQAPLYVVGVQNPYHALLDLHGDGTFRLEGVPAGTHWLRTFDAHFATVRQEVVVEVGKTAHVEIVLTARRSE
ncbi:MAG: carboxypeptidase regulatory-like domain-containing protein [Planctomycetes bacterium]|nr:carboxypeptidase regulatory-like domain-containing protein [Planctomycetota bacterium]